MTPTTGTIKGCLRPRRAPGNRGGREVGKRLTADQRHGSPHPSGQVVEHVVNATLPGRTEAVKVGPTDHAGGGTERDRLDDVASSAYSAVADNLNPVADGGCHRRHQLDRGR